MSDDPASYAVPPHIAAIIPGFNDPVPSEVPPTPAASLTNAQKTIRAMEKEQENRADKMVEQMKAVPVARIAPNGIFRHPPEFTDEEWDIIVQGLKANLPLYAIARRVNCERHFLARKIAEVQEIAQVAMDAKEGIVDESEYQLVKAAKAGSLSAIIYILDHLGQNRGWGEQKDMKPQSEAVQIQFGEIPQASIAEAEQIIAEAQKQVTPTLAGELNEIEKTANMVPQQISPQQLAVAEDTVNAIKQMYEQNKPIDVTPGASSSPPPYSPQPNIHTPEQQSRYDFLENAFSEGGESPFGAF